MPQGIYKRIIKPRGLIIKKDYALVPLTQGIFAAIDLQDVEEIGRYNWHFLRSGYARRQIQVEGKQFGLLMHRVINQTPEGLETDHIDGNRLNNRRLNLRQATGSQNNQNRRKVSGTSKYKGVSWNKRARKWTAQIENKYISEFCSETQAAKAYDNAAMKLFGEYANLNFK